MLETKKYPDPDPGPLVKALVVFGLAQLAIALFVALDALSRVVS